jgi:hypothetical protein
MKANRLQVYVINNLAYPIAGQMARRMPGVEREDLEQELTLWVLEHPDHLDRWFGDGQDFRGDGMTAAALRNCATDYANDLRMQAGVGWDAQPTDGVLASNAPRYAYADEEE